MLNKPNSLSLSSYDSCEGDHSPPLEPLQKLHIFPELLAPGLDTVLQLGPHEGRVEGDNPLPRPAPLLMQPAIQQAFWAASTHCSLM